MKYDCGSSPVPLMVGMLFSFNSRDSRNSPLVMKGLSSPRFDFQFVKSFFTAYTYTTTALSNVDLYG